MRIRLNKKMLMTAGLLLLALPLTAASCQQGSTSTGAQAQGQRVTEQAYKQQAAAVPYPADQLHNSLERQNLSKRLLVTNNPNQIGYVYLMSFGKPLGYYAIKGKVSSTSSQMTATDLIESDGCGGDGCTPPVVAAPGDDGSYGTNEPGEFFFTTEGAMIETSLDYVYSTQPIPFDVPELNSGHGH